MVQKAKSVDYLLSRGAYSSSLDIGPRKLNMGTFSPFTFSPLLGSETSSVIESESSDLSENTSGLDILPGSMSEKALETVNETPSPLKTVSDGPPRAFVDRGTYTGDSASSEDISNANPATKSPKELAPFEPVFAMAEDLIIYLKEEGGNELLEPVVQSYKNGNYPVAESNVPQVPTTPTSPASLFSSSGTSLSGASHTSAETDEDWPRGAAEIDPEKIEPFHSNEVSGVSSETSSVVSTNSPSVYPSDEASIALPNRLPNMKPAWPKKGSITNAVHGNLKAKTPHSSYKSRSPTTRIGHRCIAKDS